jgi:SAM-dependent methyltransferase
VQAHGNDPNLPAKTLDAILMVDAYQEVENRVDYLRNLANALKPTGRIGIVNWKPGRGGPGPDPNERVAQSVDEGDAAAAGLKVNRPRRSAVPISVGALALELPVMTATTSDTLLRVIAARGDSTATPTRHSDSRQCSSSPR